MVCRSDRWKRNQLGIKHIEGATVIMEVICLEMTFFKLEREEDCLFMSVNHADFPVYDS